MGKRLYAVPVTCNKCCKAGAESRGSEIKLPPGANCGFGGPQTLRNFMEKIMVDEEVFVNCYNFNPIT
jgi:hypothetical protein